MPPDDRTPSAATTRPEHGTGGSVYSNFDHALDESVVALLEADPSLYAQHAAWDFCGYVWRDADGRWFNEVWRYHAPVQRFEGESVNDVIEAANDEYGHA